MSETTNTGPLTDAELREYLAAVFIQKQLAKFVGDLKNRVAVTFKPGQQAPVSFDLDGQEFTIGTVKMSKPEKAWRVTDRAGLLKWAQDNMPELVVHVPQLDEDAVTGLLDWVKDQNAAITEHGEEIPGIEWVNGTSPSVTPTPDKKLQQTLTVLKAEGRLGELIGGLPQLTAGGES